MLLISILCITLVVGSPLGKFGGHLSRKRLPREIAPQRISLFDNDRNGVSGQQPSGGNKIKIQTENGLLNNKKDHIFNSGFSTYNSHTAPNNWWIVGNGSYAHRPSGGELFIRGNHSGSGLVGEATGKINLKKHHTLFGAYSVENKPGSLANTGTFGYLHKPSGNEFRLGTKHTNNGQLLSGTGKLNINNRHSLFGSVTGQRNGNSWTPGGEIKYLHKPSNSTVELGLSGQQGKDLFLKGQTSLLSRANHDIGITGLVSHRLGDKTDYGGALNYRHKPSNSTLALGVLNGQHGNDLFLKGQTNLLSRPNHNLGLSGILNHRIDGNTDIGGTVDYHHKPSNSTLGLGFQTNMGQPQLNGNANFNFQNGGRLGLGGHYSNGPGFSSSGFQLSAAFK